MSIVTNNLYNLKNKVILLYKKLLTKLLNHNYNVFKRKKVF